jgi:hypothetical protein
VRTSEGFLFDLSHDQLVTELPRLFMRRKKNACSTFFEDFHVQVSFDNSISRQLSPSRPGTSARPVATAVDGAVSGWLNRKHSFSMLAAMTKLPISLVF